MSLQNAPITAPGSQEVLSVPEVNYVAPQADYEVKSADKPVYQYVQVFANNVGSSVSLNATATSQAVWNVSGDIPINWGRSYLTGQINCAANAQFTTLSMDIIPIDNIALQTVGGTQLGVLFNVQAYSRIVPAITTDLQEYLARGAYAGGGTVAASLYTECKFLQPCGVLRETEFKAAQVWAMQYQYSTAADPTQVLWSEGTNAPIAASGSDKSYVGRQRLALSATGAALAALFYIPMKSFVGTILAVDRDLMFGQNLQLVINFSALNQFVWNTDAVSATEAKATATVVTGAVSLSNLYLWIAKEINGNLVARLRERLMAGYEVLIPYTYCGKNTTSSAGLYSAPQILSNGMGECLKRVVNIVCNGSAKVGLINDSSNVNAAKYTTVQSYLDANPLQYKQLQCGTAIEDYQYMYNLIKETPAGLSVREFQINSFFMDNFSSSLSHGSEIRYDDCVDDGLKLSEASKNYLFQATLTSTAGANIYQYMTWVRRLIIAPNGLQWGM